jgi:hypothetical protein
VPRVEHQSFSASYSSLIVIYDDEPDRDGEPVVLASLRCQLIDGELNWVIFDRARSEESAGRRAERSEVLALLDQRERAELEELVARYRGLFSELHAAAERL